MNVSIKKYKGYGVTDNLEQNITCHFCFEEFEVNLEIDQGFNGYNTEIYDCIVCCNPNKLSYEVYNGEIRSLSASDGNE